MFNLEAPLTKRLEISTQTQLSSGRFSVTDRTASALLTLAAVKTPLTLYNIKYKGYWDLNL